MQNFIEVDKGYYFINYTTEERPNAGPDGEDMILIGSSDQCVVDKNGFEVFDTSWTRAVSKQNFE